MVRPLFVYDHSNVKQNLLCFERHAGTPEYNRIRTANAALRCPRTASYLLWMVDCYGRNGHPDHYIRNRVFRPHPYTGPAAYGVRLVKRNFLLRRYTVSSGVGNSRLFHRWNRRQVRTFSHDAGYWSLDTGFYKNFFSLIQYLFGSRTKDISPQLVCLR